MMSELSGGQRQRVVIARAIAQDAPVLLVDEPTSSLDPEHQIGVFELLAGLVKRGRTVLVVTHELNLAAQFASRIVVLDRGRVVADGSVEEILRREVLAPVYGERLYFGRTQGAGARPFVLPWAGG
jgi:iron complex transport system ATP-binding protein